MTIAETIAYRKKAKTVFEAISKYGHDEDFEAIDGECTDLPPGHEGKLEVLRQRVERGESLFVADDRCDYEGCEPGCVRSRPNSPTEYEHSVVPTVSRQVVRKAL